MTIYQRLVNTINLVDLSPPPLRHYELVVSRGFLMLKASVNHQRESAALARFAKEIASPNTRN